MLAQLDVDPLRNLSLDQYAVCGLDSGNPRLRDLMVLLICTANQDDRIVAVHILINVGGTRR